jgi:hypothetical protein
MRTLAILIGVFVIVVLLVSSGVIGGAVCLKGVGCLSSTNGGAQINGQTTVTVGAP